MFYIPAGRVHAICSGVLLAEVQQSSDVTYRIYDYNRVGLDGMGGYYLGCLLFYCWSFQQFAGGFGGVWGFLVFLRMT